MPPLLSDTLTVLLADLATATVVFAATNVDDVFLLLAFFADRRYRMTHVMAGQYIGMATLVAVSAVASLISLALPAPWLGLLGLVPLALGLKALFAPRSDADDDDVVPPINGGSTVMTIASITIANGGDNIGVYTPLFATMSVQRIAVFVVVFAIMTALWCELARRLVLHPAWGAPIRRLSARLLPLVLIVLGVWIIAEMGTLRLLHG
jgi:cadmium resistance transport/sequestration family protein